MGFWDINASPNPDQTTRPCDNQQKQKRTRQIVDFAVPTDHRIKLKECEKEISTRTLLDNWKTMEQESDSNTNCNRCTRYSHHQNISKRIVGIRIKSTSGDHPNYTVKIGQNTEKSPRNVKRFTVIQTPVEDHQLILVWKTLKLVPLVRYSGPFLKRTREELEQMDQRTRKLMTMHKALHPRDDTDWLYVSRKERRRGLTNIEDSVDASTRLKDYIEKHGGGLITAIRNDTDNTMASRMTITRKRKCEEKQLYGRFKSLINNISYEKTWTGLRKGNFKRETESPLIVAQNNAIRTNHIKVRIDKTQQNRKYRLCGERDETINHIISECSKLAQKEYKTRHDWMGKVIHWEMYKKLKFDHTNKWYIHNPASALENDTHKLLYDFDKKTD